MIRPTVTPPFPIVWGFTTRDEAAPVLQKRMKQVHGVHIREITPEMGTLIEGDGEWTFAPGTPIGVRVADCVPVLLAGLASGRPWIAALHAGWRGAVSGILREGIGHFREVGGNPRELWYAFGPCIQPCHFEVGMEVIQQASMDPAWSNKFATERQSANPCLDLHAFLRAQAIDLGVDPLKDGSMRRCTYCEPDHFFSYRRGDTEGRQWGFAVIH
jgi:YfiH family protein